MEKVTESRPLFSGNETREGHGAKNRALFQVVFGDTDFSTSSVYKSLLKALLRIGRDLRDLLQKSGGALCY